MGGATSEIQGRRGTILSMDTQGDTIIIKSKRRPWLRCSGSQEPYAPLPRRAMWSTEFGGFEPLPASLLAETVGQIRTRKGLKPEMPKPSDYLKA